MRLPTTNRICMPKERILYVNSKVISSTSHMLVRIDQKYAPKRGMINELLSQLTDMAHENPGYFSRDTLRYLGVDDG